MLERILELVALEDHVLRSRLIRFAQMRVDGPAHDPDRARTPLDPEHDALLLAHVVDSGKRALRVPALACTAPHTRDTIASRVRVQEPLLVPLPAELRRGACREVRDPRARPRPLARRDPERPLRPEPPDARAAAAAARPSGDHRGDLRRHARGDEGLDRTEHVGARHASPGPGMPGPYYSVPTPSSCARRSASAPSATSQAASPFDLNSTMSSSDWRPASAPETTSCNSCTSSQSSTPDATGSIRSPDSIRACSSQSQQTNVARSSTVLSSSRRLAALAPAAITSAPRASHSPRNTGSRELVIVT